MCRKGLPVSSLGRRELVPSAPSAIQKTGVFLSQEGVGSDLGTSEEIPSCGDSQKGRLEMSTWPPEETVELKLPSGAKMQARLPDGAFVDMCRAALEMGREEMGTACNRDADLLHVAGAIITYTCASPRLSLSPSGPDEMLPSDMTEEDALFILGWGARRGRLLVAEQEGLMIVSERPRRPKVRRNRKVN